MTLDELKALLTPTTGGDIPKTIEALKAGRTLANLETYKKEFDVEKHDSLDKAKRPDKLIKNAGGETERMERVNRIGIAFQELITERAVAFAFGNEVKIICEPEGDKQKLVLKALNRILKDNKIDSFNAEVALEMFSITEVAECWFPVQKAEEHEDYGFKTKFKLRVTAFNPSDGNELYPLFDLTGDLIAFSRAYTVKENGKDIQYFETYTDAEKLVWTNPGNGWSEPVRTDNVIGKIPIVYGSQKKTEWANVQTLIDRLEWLLSNYADTDDYHSSPTIFTVGKIMSMPKKGESGKIIQGDKDAKAEYLSWSQAPEMVKLEIDTLFKLIYSMTQTPDISFEAVKGVGDISGVALKLLFMDAHLKVKKKKRVFDAYLDRRVNIIKSFIAYMNTSLKADVRAIDIESQIQPFIVDDLKSMIDRLTEANGGKAIMSQRTSIAQSGLVDNVEAEYKQIQEEEDRERSFDVLNPVA